MITQIRKWQRWSGSRDAVTEAIQLASNELVNWNKFASKVSVRISYFDDLTETSNDPNVLLQLHKTDLDLIRHLSIDIETDHKLWLDSKYLTSNASNETKDSNSGGFVPESISTGTSVSFRMYGRGIGGVEIEVKGEDRTQVTGLMTRLKQHFDRASLGPTFFPSWEGTFFPTLVAAFVGFLGTVIFYSIRGQKDVPFLAAAISTTVLGAFVYAVFWMLPPLEILEKGQPSRFRRTRLRIFSGFATVFLAIITNFIWIWIKPH